MALKFRLLYTDPNPIPASHYQTIKHGMTVFPAQPIDGIQFFDDEADPDDVEPTSALINTAIDLVTDEDGYLINADVDPLERLAVRAAIAADDAGEDVVQAINDAIGGAL